MNFEAVEKIAAAILYEGYILYPYRPTAIKNRQRWNFGTLYPRAYAERQRPAEPFHLVAECLVLAQPETALDIKISFLQLVRQPPSPPADAAALRLPSDPSLEWDEGIERSWQQCDLRLSDITAAPRTLPLHMQAADIPGRRSSEPAAPLQAELSLSAEQLPGGACRLRLDFQNVSPLAAGSEASRAQALPLSFVSAHVLLGIAAGEFVSLLDPPNAWRDAAAACHSIGVLPVLAGEEPDRHILLCSPIFLYDYPKIAPESVGDFFDGTEMDEMLTLRVLTLTDAEKAEMRAGDARGRALLERTEALTSDSMLKAHGAIRGMREIRGDPS